MTPLLFAGLVAGTILIALLGLGAVALLALRSRTESQIRRRLVPETGALVEFEDTLSAPLLTSMARGGRVMEGLVDTEGESARLLLQAGWRRTDQRVLWYAFQAVLPVVLAGFVLAFWVFAEVPNKGLMVLLFGFAAVVLAFLMPRWILRGIAASRQRRVKSEVPLFLHLLVLLFEAGLSTRQALASLVRRPLADGVGLIAHVSLRLGPPRPRPASLGSRPRPISLRSPPHPASLRSPPPPTSLGSRARPQPTLAPHAACSRRQLFRPGLPRLAEPALRPHSPGPAGACPGRAQTPRRRGGRRRCPAVRGTGW